LLLTEYYQFHYSFSRFSTLKQMIVRLADLSSWRTGWDVLYILL